MTYSFVSNSVVETEAFAKQLAARLKGDEVFVFKSDVGGGKTTFVRALVAALGSDDHVSSPTFTVSKVYTAGQFRIVHFDFYRLQDPQFVADALQEEVSDKNTICFIEWPTAIGAHIASAATITIEKDPSIETKRQISMRVTESNSYLLKGISW